MEHEEQESVLLFDLLGAPSLFQKIGRIQEFKQASTDGFFLVSSFFLVVAINSLALCSAYSIWKIKALLLKWSRLVGFFCRAEF